MEKHIKLFTDKDLDGVGCAILANLAFGGRVDIEYRRANEINERMKEFLKSEVSNYRLVFITDLSVNEENAETIDKCIDFKKSALFLFDHHKSALWLTKYKWCMVEVETAGELTSGTMLFFDYLCYLGLFPKGPFYNKQKYVKSIFEFATIVRKYDTWLWKNKYNDHTPEMWNNLLYIYGRDKFIELTLDKIYTNKVTFSYTDIIMLEAEARNKNEYIKSKLEEVVKKDVLGYKAGIVFAERYSSMLGNSICEENKDIDFAVIVNMPNSVSYRATKEEIDVSKIAVSFKGGGHAKAAGNPIKKEVAENLIKDIFSKEEI